MIKATIKIYASLRLLSLLFMGIVYANQDHDDLIDDVTNHRHIMVAPTKSSVDESVPTPQALSNFSKHQTEEQNKRPVRVLALGGGGTRGIGSAEILNVLESVIYESTGKKLNEFFDVIVGTSTGGIQAVGIGAGIAAKELKEIYYNESQTIFKTNGWMQWLLGGIWGPNYSTDGLRETMKKHIKIEKMSELKSHIGLTVYDDVNERTYLLTNQIPQERQIDYTQPDLPGGNITPIEGLEATTAAPTYYAKKVISEGTLLDDANYTGEVHQYVDGGVSANDPAALAKSYAQRLINQGAFDETYTGEIQLVAIGTGREQPIVFNEKAGIFGFGKPGNIPSYFMNSATAATHAILATELEEGKSYFRLQFDLPYAIPLDTTDQRTLKLIEQKAHATTETNYFHKMTEVLCGKSISEVQNVSLSPKTFSSQLIRTQKPVRFVTPVKQLPLIAAAAA